VEKSKTRERKCRKGTKGNVGKSKTRERELIERKEKSSKTEKSKS